MLDALIASLDAHDRALTASHLRRGGASPFRDAPALFYALLGALESDPPPSSAARVQVEAESTAVVIDLEAERAVRRPSVVVEGQASPLKPVRRSLCESPHYLKEPRS